MNIRRTLVLACAAAIAGGMTEGVTAQQLAGSSRFHPLSLEQGQEAGIQLIAQSFGISLDAARSRMNVEEHAPDIVASIRTQYADRLAGLYIEHAPTHRVVVRLTGVDAVPSEAYQFGDDQLEVVYQVGAEHTFADLQQRFNAGFAALKQQVPALQSGYVDERSGEIVLEVVNDRPGIVIGREAVASDRNTANEMAAQQRLADDYFGVSTRVVPMGRIENQTIYGSGNLDFVQGGVNLYCTGAFTVKSTTSPVKYGLLTAGHCQSDTGIYNYTEAAGGTTTASLTHVARRFDSATDVGWATIGTNAADAGNSFYSGSTHGWQTQGSRLTKTGTSVGMSLCHYGRTTTAGSCGTVASVAYNPGAICGPTVVPYGGSDTCSATYIAVDSVACSPMDSGGPWTSNITHPAGVHKAGNTTSGRCVYTSTDDIIGTPLNLQLL